LLLAGYAYAHLLRTTLSPKAQRWTHLGVLTVALLFLPPAPRVHLAANTSGTPVWELLRCLFTSIGVPFFALSATAPLLMEWFRQSFPGRSHDRLYAFSNAGSLLALLAYPVLLEPAFTLITQARLWAAALGLFLAVCALAAWRSRPAQPLPAIPPLPFRRGEGRGEGSVSGLRSSGGKRDKLSGVSLPAWLWIALPACGSGLLLALTNQLSQDVAPMPLLWVVPMAVYLLTFILCFEGPRSYKRGLFIPAAFLSFFFLAWLLDQGYLQAFSLQVGGYLAVLFLGCMVCHGELYRLRPRPERLTAYYLAISLGGALGGVFVALVAPALFKTFLETPIITLAVAGLVTFILWRERPKWSFPLPAQALALVGCLAIASSLGYVLLDLRKQSIYVTRSFYGAYRVKEGPTMLLDGVDWPLAPGTARILLSGQIYHGLQFTNPAAAMTPTAYFCEEEGLGVTFRALPARTNRNIGAVGLGAGTLAAYARAGDHLRFYEINPDVVRIAQTHFTFLTNCPARVDVILGDGRLSLEREPGQSFDLLVLDAFAGDSIPLHLLTDQAMGSYRRLLKPEGVLAFHISNSHLDLQPVLRALADKHGLTAVLAPPRRVDPREGKLLSMWMLLSANREFLNHPEIAALLRSTDFVSPRQPLLWTDDYSSILPILH
jgi:SAM-dependent methyltransferase